MFDIGWSELLVIAVVAIIFVGPRELIPMLRTIGKQVGSLKRMASEFQGQFNEALREAELDTIKQDVEKIGRLDPLRDIKDKVTKDMNEVTRKLDVPAKPAVKPAGKQPETPAALASAAEAQPEAPKTSDEQSASGDERRAGASS